MKIVLLLLSALFLTGHSVDENLNMMDQHGKEIIPIETKTSYGSAFPVRIGNYNVTVSAAHVCVNPHVSKAGKRYIKATYNNDKYALGIIKVFKSADICFLQPIKGIKPFKLDLRPKKHERVFALGYPLSSFATELFSFDGLFKYHAINEVMSANPEIVEKCSSLGPNHYVDKRQIKGMFGPMEANVCVRKEKVIVTTARGAGGISGGPTLNKQGEVIGINMLTTSRQNLLVLVPSSEIVRYWKNRKRLK